jgi:response regulator RpfG family c-di-GMP phosphodiesterase
MDNNTKPSVLIIDDDLDYLEIIKRGLSNDFNIIAIESFQKLKSKIHGFKPSIILLDLNFGNTRPVDVIDYIKSLEFLQGIPLYLVSGSDLGRKAGIENQVNGFIVKPATFSGVRDMLYAALPQASSF